MKNIKRVLLTAIVLINCIYFQQSINIQAAEAAYTASVPSEADAGTQIAVKILVYDNPGLTTLGLRLGYDEKILSYQKDTWTDELSSGNNSLTLVSDVTYEGKKVLNISMIDSSVYRENGTIVTLYFNVLEAYSDCPITLQFRDATDGNENPISGNTRVVLASEPTTNMNQNTGHKESSGGEYDKSFKTGGFVWTPVLFGIWVVFIGIAVSYSICQHRLKKHGRREIQNIIGFKEN